MRFTWVDFLVLSVVIAVVAFIYYRVDTVLDYKWNWSVIPQYFFRWDASSHSWVSNLLIEGLLTTLRLAVWGIVFAAIVGTVMGLCRTSNNLFLRMVSRTYVELVRNIPPLVFIFLFYFFISSQLMPLLGLDYLTVSATGWKLTLLTVLFGKVSLIENFVSGVIVLTLFEGAYVTEVVRSGIQSVDRGQWEGGASVGLTKFAVLRYIVLPQAVRRIIPPLANQFISLIKDSSIVALISIEELTFFGIEIATSTTRVFEVWITVAAMYFVICSSCSLVLSKLEARAMATR